LLTVDNIEKIYKVTEKNSYSSFLEMVTIEGFESVIPDKNTAQEAVEVYYKFFTKTQEVEFGVVAIRIEEVE
jgi:ASC-1-like (ASCH) protein